LLLLSLGLLLAGGCSKDVCEEAYEKVQECVASMDCDAMGPGLSDQCRNEQKKYKLSYTLYLAACRLPSGDPCSCDGLELEKWERINKCTLEPANMCGCK